MDISQQVQALTDQLAGANTANNRLRVERTKCQNDFQRLTDQFTESAKTLEHVLHDLMVANTEKVTLSNELEAAIRRASELEQSNGTGAPIGTGHTHAPGDGPLTKEEMNDLTHEMDEAGKVMAKYQEAIRALEKRVDRLRTANPLANEAEIVRLNKEIADFKTQHDHCKESKKGLTDQIEKLNNDVAQHNANHVRKDQACNDCQREKDDPKKTHMQELNMIIRELGIQTYMGAPHKAIVAALGEFKKASANNSALRNQATQDAATITRLRSDIRTHEMEIFNEGTLKGKITTLRSQEARDTAVIERLKAQVATLQAQSGQQQPSAAVDDGVTALQTEITNLKKKITDLKKQVADLKTDKANCDTDKDHYEQRIKAIIARAAKAEKEKAEADYALARRHDKISVEKADISSEEEADELFAEYQLLLTQVRDLRTDLKNSQTATNVANATLRKGQSRIQDLTDQLADFNDSITGQSPTHAELTSQLAAAQSQATKLQTRLDAANANGVSAARNSSSGLPAQLQATFARIRELEAAAERARSNADLTKLHFADQNTAATAEITALKAQIAPYNALIARIGRNSGKRLQEIDIADEIDRLNEFVDARDEVNALLTERNTGLLEAAALHQQALANANAQRRAAEKALAAASVSVPSGAAVVVVPGATSNNAEIQAMRDQLDEANNNNAQLRQRLIGAVASQPAVSNPSVGDRLSASPAPEGPPKKKRKVNGAAIKAAQLAAEARAYLYGNMWKYDPIAGPFRR